MPRAGLSQRRKKATAADYHGKFEPSVPFVPGRQVAPPLPPLVPLPAKPPVPGAVAAVTVAADARVATVASTVPESAKLRPCAANAAGPGPHSHFYGLFAPFVPVAVCPSEFWASTAKTLPLVPLPPVRPALPLPPLPPVAVALFADGRSAGVPARSSPAMMLPSPALPPTLPAPVPVPPMPPVAVPPVAELFAPSALIRLAPP